MRMDLKRILPQIESLFSVTIKQVMRENNLCFWLRDFDNSWSLAKFAVREANSPTFATSFVSN